MPPNLLMHIGALGFECFNDENMLNCIMYNVTMNLC